MSSTRCRIPTTAVRRLAHTAIINLTPVTPFIRPLSSPSTYLPQSTSYQLSLPHPRYSSSSSRWKTRQQEDHLVRAAKVANLKSRAAFKLLELDEKYRLFKRISGGRVGQVVADLGFAPGSWSQVAVDRVGPNGIVVGIDILPAQPPRGVSTFQGNFLDPGVQKMVKDFLVEETENKRQRGRMTPEDEENEGDDVVEERKSYIDLEREVAAGREQHQQQQQQQQQQQLQRLQQLQQQQQQQQHQQQNEQQQEEEEGDVDDEIDRRKKMRVVDVVLSDMSEPWPQTQGFTVNSLNNPYLRMMNTSGISFADHARSMDLCRAALSFANDTLKPGGHFVCKYYQGSEDKDVEKLLKKLFTRVHREKPESSRSESKESFFVALKRKGDVILEDI